MVRLPLAGIDHIGIASASGASWLSDAVEEEPLRGKVMPSGVAVAHFGPEGQLELVWPDRPGCPIDRFLERRGPGLHHLALRIDGRLDELVETLHSEGIRTAGQIETSSDGRSSVFLHPSTTGGLLIELVEGARE
jgi:hypothetical protein